jgi:hypothetical protein
MWIYGYVNQQITPSLILKLAFREAQNPRSHLFETGTVALIRKRDEVVGGSDRKKLVTELRKQKRHECCLRVPILGALFELCWKPEPIPTNEKIFFNLWTRRSRQTKQPL